MPSQSFCDGQRRLSAWSQGGEKHVLSVGQESLEIGFVSTFRVGRKQLAGIGFPHHDSYQSLARPHVPAEGFEIGHDSLKGLFTGGIRDESRQEKNRYQEQETGRANKELVSCNLPDNAEYEFVRGYCSIIVIGCVVCDRQAVFERCELRTSVEYTV